MTRYWQHLFIAQISKYQLFNNRKEKIRIKKLKSPKAFIDYWQTIDYAYEILEDYNPAKKRKVLIVFGDMIAYREVNKKIRPKATELILTGKKLNGTCFYITLSF